MKESMDETISGATGASSPEPSHPRRARLANALKLISAVLVVGVILGGYILLFASRRSDARHTSASGSGHPQPPSGPPDSFGWARVQTIAIAQGTLYTSDGFHYLYAIQMSDGAAKHSYFDRIGFSPLIDHGVLYMAVEQESNSYMKAWRLGDGQLTPLWSYQMICCARSTFAVANGMVYVFAGGGIGSISALRASDGRLMWNYATNGPSGASLTVANGILYAGMDGDIRGGVYAFQASTGKLVWKSQDTGGTMAAPLVVHGIAYVASTNRSVYALNATTGALLWRYTTDYAMMAAPVVSNGVVYVGTGANSVYALRASNGSLVWHQRIDKLLYPLPNDPNGLNGVFVGVVDYGTVYAGSEDGYMAALRASDGALLWHRQMDGQVVSPFAVQNNVVYVSAQDGYTNKSAIYALQAGDGGQLWRTPTGLLTPNPSSAPTQTGMIPITRTGIPAFTLADVTQYFKEHPFLTTAGKPGTIVKLAFMTSAQASVLMKGESVGLPDDALVCYVELHGPFLLNGISVPQGAKIPTVQNVYYVIDAQTGRELVFGSMG